MIVINVDIFNFHVFVCTRVYLFICCNLAPPPPKIQKNFSKTPFPSKKTLILFFIGQTLWHECPDYS